MHGCVENWKLWGLYLQKQIPHCSTTKEGSTLCFVLVCVDDIIVASSSHEATDPLHKDLEREFALKDLGPSLFPRY